MENNLLNKTELKSIIEAILFTQGKDMDINQISRVLKDGLIKKYGEEDLDLDFINKKNLESALDELISDYSNINDSNNNNSNNNKGVELVCTALGYRFQAKAEYKDFLQCLEIEKPPKYSKAVLETLSIIAYRQPITRAEIEVIRGVAVSSEVVKKLLDREWIQVIGHKEVPGRPAVYATTKNFLSDLGLKRLEDLPIFELPEEEQSNPKEINNDEKSEIVLESKKQEQSSSNNELIEEPNKEVNIESEVV